MFSWKDYTVFGISLYYIIRVLKSLSLSKRVFTMYFNASQKHSSKHFQIHFLRGLVAILLLGESSGTLFSIVRAKTMLWIQEDAILIFYIICYSCIYIDVYYLYGKCLFTPILCNSYISAFLEYFGEIRRCIAICNRIEVFYLLYQMNDSPYLYFGMPIIAGVIQSDLAILLTPFYESYWICNEYKKPITIHVEFNWRIYFGVYASIFFFVLLQGNVAYREIILISIFLLQKYYYTNQGKLISKASQSNLLSHTLQQLQ